MALVKTSNVGAAVGGAVLGMAAWPLEVVVAILAGEPLQWPSVAEVLVDPLDAVAALAAFGVVTLVPPSAPEHPS